MTSHIVDNTYNVDTSSFDVSVTVRVRHEEDHRDSDRLVVNEGFPLLLAKCHSTSLKSGGTFATSDETSFGSISAGSVNEELVESTTRSVAPGVESADLENGTSIQAAIDAEKVKGDPSDETCVHPLQNPEIEEYSTIVEGVVEEFQEVTQAVLDEFHKADNNEEHYMMEMGLTRNLSLLPGDVVDASVALAHSPPTPPDNHDEDDIEMEPLVEKEKKPETDVKASHRIPISAYLLLATAVFSLSAIGPLLQLQHNVSPSMKIFWRMAGTALMLVPFAFVETYQHGLPKLTTPQWIIFLLGTICYDVFCVTFCLALDYTAVGNVVILSNTMALLLLVGKLCTGSPVTGMELAGAIVAFGGAALCSKDSANVHGDSDLDNALLSSTLIGDLLALLSAIGGVGYVAFAKATRSHMPICMFMFLTMTVGCALILAFQVWVLQETVTNDLHPSHGLWGFLVWWEADRLPLEVLMVVVCNLFGAMGYVRAMPHFSSLVICSVTLLEPVIAEFMSFFAGVGVLPGLLGWWGNFLVAAGTYVVICQSQTAGH